MLLQEHFSCLCRGENGKPFCLAELWPALIVRIHWDFTINAVQRSEIQKIIYFGFAHAFKVHFRSTERQTFYWPIMRLMTASNVDAWTQAWQAKWVVFKMKGLSASVSFLSTPPPPRSFTCAIFRAVFDSCFSFFAPKEHRNACYAGYRSPDLKLG